MAPRQDGLFLARNLFLDADPFALAAQESLQQHSGASVPSLSQVPGRRPKLSSIVDQGDDTVSGGASTRHVSARHQQYITVTGARPQEEEQPSVDPPQALHHRSGTLGNAPHVDHAVWGLSGRKATRANRFRSWIPTADGSYISRELPALENFLQWLTSRRVFEAAALEKR